MLDKKYIVRLGGKYYGYDFYAYNDIRHCVSENINSARLSDKLSTAKSNATRVRNILLRWAKDNVQNDPRLYEPIEVVEVDLSVGAVTHTKDTVLHEV